MNWRGLFIVAIIVLLLDRSVKYVLYKTKFMVFIGVQVSGAN